MALHIGNFLGVAAASGTRVPATGALTTVIPENLHRRAAMIYNFSEAILFLKLGTNASSNDFTVKMGSGSYYEVPLPMYTGSITGIWTATTGSAMVTELTSD